MSKLFDKFKSDYSSQGPVEMSIDEYLDLAKTDRMAYATPYERMLEKSTSAWANRLQGSSMERPQAWSEVNRLRAMLEAAPEPKGQS